MLIKITTTLNSKLDIRFSQLRFLAQLASQHKENAEEKMYAWQIHCYGGLDELQQTKTRIPVLSTPSDVLIKVDSASVNPIDVAMIQGYGSKAFNLLRKAKSFAGRPHSDIEFPLTLGRDFAGTVVSKGHGVNKLKVGDEVWGVIPIEQQGCHADYVLVDSCLVNLRPQNISYLEAASILYSGLTAWSALWYTGGFCYKTSLPTQSNKRILVIGGSGGVGTFAVQLLKAWNMQVVTTCSTDAVDMLHNLGADVVVDYKKDDADSQIIAEGPYDIILDCAKQGPDLIKSKGYPYSNYISLNSPFLKNIDDHGVIVGGIKNFGEILKYNIPIDQKTNLLNSSLVKWGFFAPSPSGIKIIQELVESKKIIPIVQEVFPYEEIPKAYQKVSQGHLRGKIVVDMK